MPEPSSAIRAVFLSYASQDAEAAARICETLRAAGIEVWFDQSELRGGDAWDSTIKKQIHECALFVPVISAHTNARTEGYFRREWNLAKHRLMDMAEDAPFLLPVLIDESREDCARVPEEFLSVQWTRLPGGESPPAFAHRVRQLLNEGGELKRHSKNASVRGIDPSTRKTSASRPWNLFAGAPGVTAALVSLLLALCGGAYWYFQITSDAPTSRPTPTAPSPSTAASLNDKSVAVLPFVALSSGKDDGYFADGLTEEIINALTTVPDLLVTARTSAFHFKGKNTPIPEISMTLGVAHVVDGSVRRSGERVRISAQLIRAADGFHLWSQTYDRPPDDTFAIQTEIAEHVAGALGVLLDDHQRRMMADAGVRDVDAFIAYQRGLELFNRAHNDGPLVPLLAQANVEFDAAIARSPDFAQAFFQHADYFAHFLIDEAPGKGANFQSEAGLDVAEAERRLIADLDAALRYEKDSGQRRVIDAVRTTVTSDWRGLKDQIQRAYAAWDNCRFGLWLDQTAILFGFGEAVHQKDLERARCDPLGSAWYRAAESAIWIGRPLDGLALADRAEAMQGRNSYTMHARILANLALGRTAEAEKLLAEGRFESTSIPEFQRLLLYQVPAATGRLDGWARLKTNLARDPEQLLVAAAVYGDRETADQTAAKIDAMPLGPAILIRITDRCGCGKPFGLSATPKFAHILSEADLAFEPLEPIKFPLKDW